MSYGLVHEDKVYGPDGRLETYRVTVNMKYQVHTFTVRAESAEKAIEQVKKDLDERNLQYDSERIGIELLLTMEPRINGCFRPRTK